jgi:hypothetical protein
MARSFNIHQSIAAASTTPDVITTAGINAYFRPFRRDNDLLELRHRSDDDRCGLRR